MELIANLREISGKKVKVLRKEGIVPASIYGPRRKSTNIQFDKKAFISLFKTIGFNQFFDLKIEGETKKSKALVKEIQKNPLNDHLVSVSLYEIDEETKINVDVPIEIIGESPAVKLNLGFLIIQNESLDVHCFPKDLPSSIKIDISKLENPGDVISVSDIQLPEGVEFSSEVEPSSAIVYIGTAQKEEEVAVAAESETAEGEQTTTEETAKE